MSSLRSLLGWGLLMAWAASAAELSNQELIASLSSADDAARIEATYALARQGSDVVPQLVTVLQSARPLAAAAAAQAFYVMGKSAKSALPLLYASLDSQYPDVRQWSLRALGTVTKGTDDAVPYLSSRLSDESPAVREAAIDALLDIARTTGLRELLPALRDPHPRVRLHAVKGLRRYLHYSETILRALCDVLVNDGSPEVRAAAAETLADSDPTASFVGVALADALADREQSVSEAAADALAKLSALAELIQPELQTRRNGPNPASRASALIAFIVTDPDHKEAASTALKAGADHDPQIRAAACQGLELLLRSQKSDGIFEAAGEPPGAGLLDAMKTLRPLATGGPLAVRAAALRPYIRLAEIAREWAFVSSSDKGSADSVTEAGTYLQSFLDAVAALRSALALPSSSVRTAALSSAGYLWDKDYSISIEKPDLATRERAALSATYQQLTAMTGLTDSIVRTLDGTNATVKGAAVSTLGTAGHKIAITVGDLNKAEPPDDEVLALTTIKMLDKLSAIQLQLRGAIRNALVDPEPTVRSVAAEAAGNAFMSDPTTIKRLIRLFGDPVPAVREQAAQAFYERANDVGVQDAYESLTKPIKDGDPRVAKTALAAAAFVAYHLQDSEPERITTLFSIAVPRLASADDELRGEAVDAVSSFGMLDREAVAVQLMSASLADPSSKIRYNVVESMRSHARHKVQGTLEPCMTGAEDVNSSVRERALLCLQDHGYAARPALSLIIGNLDHKNLDIRRTAAEALPVFGAEAKDAVPALTRLLSDSDSLLRSMSMSALGAIGPASASSAPTLLKIARDDKEARADVAGVLERIGPDALPAIDSEAIHSQGDFREFLNHLHQGLARVRDGVTWQLMTAGGVPRAVNVPGGTVVAMLATWCPYSREFREKIIAEQSTSARSSRKYIFLFADEHPYVEAELVGLAKEKNWSDEERQATSARLKDSFRGTPFMNPDFLQDLPGDVYLVPAAWELMPDGFPSVYSFIENDFSINGLVWLDENMSAPKSGLDKLFAVFRKIGQRGAGRQSRNPSSISSKQ